MTGYTKYTESRDMTFDVMKGIGLFMMVTGHTVGPESPIHSYIYAFHMPLFFMISGYFAKKKEHTNNVISLYSRLIRPFLFISVIVVLLKAILHYHNYNTIYFDWEIVLNGVGPGWFLLAMFWGRTLFNFLIHLPPYQYLITTLIVSSIPTFLQWTGLYINLPFCIMQGLSCTFFIATGHFARQVGLLQLMTPHIRTCTCISLLLWLNTSVYGEIEMSAAFFKLWIIDFLGAFGGIFLTYSIAKLIVNHTERITYALSQVSIFSLAIFAFHSIDFCVHFWYHLHPIVSPNYMVITILFMRFALFYPIIKITTHFPFLYHLFIERKTNKKVNK